MKERLLPLAILLVVVVGLAVFIERFIRQVLLQPLLYTAWVADLFVRSLPQGVFWGLFILFALYLAFKALSFRRTRPVFRTVRRLEQVGPVAQWQHRLQRARQQDYASWTLMRELRRLTLEIVTGEQSTHDPDSTDTVSLQAIDLPAPLMRYFNARMEGIDSPWRALVYRLLPSGQGRHGGDESLLHPEAVVTYLEERTMVRDQSV